MGSKYESCFYGVIPTWLQQQLFVVVPSKQTPPASPKNSRENRHSPTEKRTHCPCLEELHWLPWESESITGSCPSLGRFGVGAFTRFLTDFSLSVSVGLNMYRSFSMSCQDFFLTTLISPSVHWAFKSMEPCAINNGHHHHQIISLRL